MGRWATVVASAAGFAVLLYGYKQAPLSVAGAELAADNRSIALPNGAGVRIDPLTSWGMFGAATLSVATACVVLNLLRAHLFASLMGMGAAIAVGLQAWMIRSLLPGEQARLARYLAERQAGLQPELEMSAAWLIMLFGTGLMVAASIAGIRGGLTPSPGDPGGEQVRGGKLVKPLPDGMTPVPAEESLVLNALNEQRPARGWLLLMAAVVPIVLWLTATVVLISLLG